MKKSPLMPALILLIGIGIGVAVDRMVLGKGGSQGFGQLPSSQRPTAPKPPVDQGGGAGNLSKARPRAHPERNPAATIRRVSQLLELSPMINTDLESLLEAYNAIRWMGPEDVRLALAELDRHPGMNQGDAMLRFMLMGLWAKSDGMASMEYAMGLKQPSERMMAAMNSMMSWMKHDAVGAYDWYRNNRGEFQGGLEMEGMLIAALARQDMGMAFRELGALSGQSQAMALSMMASTVGMDPDKRSKFIEGLEKIEDVSLRQNGMMDMITTWALADPLGAMQYLESMDPKPENHAELEQMAASGLIDMDPEAAIEWQIRNLNRDEVASDSIASSFGQWVANDSESAAEWLAKQPAEMATDDLFASASESLVWVDPEAATRWAAKIDDENRRQEALSLIRSTYLSRGAEALSKWKESLEPSIRVEVESLNQFDAAPIPTLPE